jgi:hypothetical protein
MKPTLTVRQTLNNVAGLRKAVAALTEQDVYVGIPADHTNREGAQGISNAELGYIHEFGAPANNLPARAALLPGIRAIQDDAAALLKDAAASALAGKPGAVETALNKIGLLGQNSVRARFVDNDWAPLSDRTLDYRPLKKDDTGAVMTDKKGNAQRKKSRRERGNINPLLDSGQLRKAYTYVLRQRQGNMVIK